MAADVHIHIFAGLNEEDLKLFFSYTLGSKYFNPSCIGDDENVTRKVAKTPNIWVGEVSWLKAAFLHDDEHYIPLTIERIQEIIGEDLPIIDDKLIVDICSAFDLVNKTEYKISKKENIQMFLEEHRGKRVFTVSW